VTGSTAGVVSSGGAGVGAGSVVGATGAALVGEGALVGVPAADDPVESGAGEASPVADESVAAEVSPANVREYTG
jgi:hypothetical protein